MNKRTGKAGNASRKWGRRGAGRGADAAGRRDDGDARELLEWVHAHGVRALQAVFRAEAEAVAGPKGQHQEDRTHHHWGRPPRS